MNLHIEINMNEISYYNYEDVVLVKRQLEEIVQVGGTTKISKVEQLLKDFVQGKDPNKGVNPNKAVAYGVVAHQRILSREVANDIVS